ncbi:related to pyrazinamidase/nicotinamidase [Cephalotrichum gorgonifer]|uniref:nicotinamidase n=1 Tax=Cephalotrichum gorgonifer TaxID=2041049 RepID=A0AAE8MZ45_9PEZI|nr:related to pyrazinamidase/nicotinamidase [Cephalotrichum gorgonifer]
MSKSALIVVDVQEDFCPPNGSLAVPDGRDILQTVNTLLARPFALKLATQDWHPPTHISFSANHPGTSPFTSKHTITHPTNPSKSYSTTLWPTHCVQDTPGAELVPGLRADLLDDVVKKGKREDVEMYSAFYDPFRLEDSGLAGRLRGEGVGVVFVVGLAGDYCVKRTAVDAAREGFETYVVEEGTRCVDPGAWERVKEELEVEGVRVVGIGGLGGQGDGAWDEGGARGMKDVRYIDLWY